MSHRLKDSWSVGPTLTQRRESGEQIEILPDTPCMLHAIGLPISWGAASGGQWGSIYVELRDFEMLRSGDRHAGVAFLRHEATTFFSTYLDIPLVSPNRMDTPDLFIG